MRISIVFFPLLAVSLLAGMPAWGLAQPQKTEPPPPPSLLPTGLADPRWGEKLETLTEATKAGDWGKTTKLLQQCFDAPPDVLAPVTVKGPDDKETKRSVGLHSEALRRLVDMPAAGRAAYRKEAEQPAAALLAEARKDVDNGKLESVFLRYPGTPAGAEALRELAARHGRVGHYYLALAALGHLERQMPVADWPTDLLVEAAILYRRAALITRQQDHRERAEALAKLVAERREKRFVTLLEDSKVQDADIVARAVPPGDWRVFGGNIQRAGQGQGDAPVLEARWALQTAQYKETAELLKKVAADLSTRKEPLIPGSSPLVVTVNWKGEQVPLVFYRSTWGIHAAAIKDGKSRWYNPSSWGLDQMFQDPFKRPTAEVWSNELVQNKRGYLMFENTTTGTLSSDGRYVFLIDDFQIKPFSITRKNEMPSQIVDGLNANTLLAYDLASGKLKWVLDVNSNELVNPYIHYLAPPLPLDGRLYVLIEKKGALQLLWLYPVTGGPLAIYPLGEMKQSLPQEPLRRGQAAHLAYGNGILLCLTNAGSLLGVDLLSGSLAWSHVYRGADEAVPATSWKVTAPIVVGDKVVFTAPDSAYLCCVRLRDGALIWKVARAADDVYLGGVVAGKVLVVTRGAVRALNLENGAEVWKQATGMPSGLGAVVGDRYYVPLLDTAAGVPAIGVLDVGQGKVVEFLRSKDKVVPGNLVFAGGVVVSQSATEVQVFPLAGK
jgi:outer membrane protein assembly factor BamB